MSALEKFLMKAGGKAKGFMKGEEVLGPAGAFKRSGYQEAGKPIMRPRFDGPERSGGIEGLLEKLGVPEGMDAAKSFATKSPLHAGATGAALGAGGMAAGGGLAAALEGEPDGDEGQEDEEGELKTLLHKLGI